MLSVVAIIAHALMLFHVPSVATRPFVGKTAGLRTSVNRGLPYVVLTDKIMYAVPKGYICGT
jgi:hypothetical protein